MFRLTLSAIGILAVIATSAAAQSASPNGVKTLSPAGAIKPTGTRDLATRAGDFHLHRRHAGNRTDIGELIGAAVAFAFIRRDSLHPPTD
jgi:hypothetical protein